MRLKSEPSRNFTLCEMCIHAEQSGMETVICTMAVLWFGRCQHSNLFDFSGLLGNSWYERHKEKYIESGDIQELVRMTRHVT